jgi:hypothetical protein
MTGSRQIPFEADMRGLETQPFIKPKGVIPASVAGQLYDVALLGSAEGDGPFDHQGADLPAAKGILDPNSFDLETGAAGEGQMRDRRNLHATDDLSRQISDDEPIIRVTPDRIEGFPIGGVDA